MPCSIDHSTIKAGGFCTSCGVRIEFIEPTVQPVQQSAPSVNYCPNGHAVTLIKAIFGYFSEKRQSRRGNGDSEVS